MTQTAPQSLGSGRVSAPFPSPPGLELGPVAAEASASAVRSPIGSQLGSIGQPVGEAPNRAEVVEAVRRVLMTDVDSKVSEKVEELWNRGKTMLSQVHQRQQKKADELSLEISRCLEKQRALEAENEQLKTVLTGLAARLSMLGPGFGGCHEGTPATTAGGSSVASASPPHTNGTSDLFSPGTGTSAGTVAANGSDSFPATPLPEVPVFPFPAAPTPASTAAPLSLAEALGPPTPMQPQGPGGPMPLSLASSLPPSPLETSSPFTAGAASAPQVFSFTLRKADETDLGLNVTQDETEKVLVVEGVRPDGAVDAWNRQCMGGAFSEKAVMRGDKIIRVNSVANDPEKMLEECKEKQLLRLTLVRGERLPEASQVSPPGLSPTKSTSLRADATEFVPMSAATTAATREEAAADSTKAS